MSASWVSWVSCASRIWLWGRFGFIWCLVLLRWVQPNRLGSPLGDCSAGHVVNPGQKRTSHLQEWTGWTRSSPNDSCLWHFCFLLDMVGDIYCIYIYLFIYLGRAIYFGNYFFPFWTFFWFLLPCFFAFQLLCFWLFCFFLLLCFYSYYSSLLLLLCFFASLPLPPLFCFSLLCCFSSVFAFCFSLLLCLSVFPSFFLFLILQIILKKHHINSYK